MAANTTNSMFAECIICTTKIRPDPQLRLPCGHVHCESCLLANFRVTMRSNPFRPVQCCQRIDLTVLRRIAGIAAGISSYREKLTEFDTPNKLYCWDPKCSTFIPPALRAGSDGGRRSLARSAQCRKCHTKTCMLCNNKFHFGPCSSISAVRGPVIRSERQVAEEAFQRLRSMMGWKKCPTCKRVVEKTEGCNHIV